MLTKKNFQYLYYLSINLIALSGILATEHESIDFEPTVQEGLDAVKQLLASGHVKINDQDKNNKTLAMHATFYQKIDILNFLIEKQANLNIQNKNGETALMIGLDDFEGKREIKLVTVESLIKAGADTNIRNKHDDTPLIKIITKIENEEELLKFVTLLVDQGNANINEADGNKTTPLVLAIYNEHPKVSKYLLDKSPDVDVIDDDGDNAVGRATYNNDIDLLKLLIETAKAKVNPDDEKVNHPLMIALDSYEEDREIKIETIRYLINTGKVKANIAINGETPLSKAVKNIKNEEEVLEVVKLLAEQGGANVNETSPKKTTLLMETVFRKYLKVSKYLIDKNVNIDIVDENNYNAVGLATYNNDIDMLELLIEKFEAKVNPDDEKVNHPLMIALDSYQETREIKIETIRYLINTGKAKANIAINGETPLLRAIDNIKDEEELLEVIRLLVEKGGANVNQGDLEGITPLMRASQAGYLKVVKYLLEQGADLNQESQNDNVAIISATQGKRYDIMNYFLDSGKIVWKSRHLNQVLFQISDLKDVPNDIIEKLFIHPEMIDIEQKNAKGNTLFIRGAMRGNLHLLQLIAQHFPAEDVVNQHNNRKQTGLMFACYLNHFDVVKYLVETLKANIYLADEKNYTAFMRANQQGSINIVKYFADDIKINPNKKIQELRHSITMAIEENYIETAQYLLEVFKTKLDQEDVNQIAKSIAQYGQDAIMKTLLEIPNLTNLFTIENPATNTEEENKATFLHYLITKHPEKNCKQQEKVEILKLLIQHKKIDLQNQPNIISAVVATKHHQFAIAKYIIKEANPEINLETASQLFQETIKYTNSDMMDYLLKHKQINTFFDPTTTPLDNLVVFTSDPAKREEQAKIFDLLLQHEKINLNDEKQLKKIWFTAAATGNTSIIKSYLDKKILEPTITNDKKQNVIMVAASSGATNVIELLIETNKINIKINDKDDDGKTAYDLAVDAQQPRTAAYIGSLEKKANESTDNNNTNDNKTENNNQNNNDTNQDTIKETPLKNNENQLSKNSKISIQFMLKIAVASIIGIATMMLLPYYYLAQKRKKKNRQASTQPSQEVV